MEPKLNLTIVPKTAEQTGDKRLASYLKGGIFSTTYKTLILDLLSKKLSANVVSGFVINQAQNINEKCAE